MTAKQMRWAATHDWYINADLIDVDTYRVWVRSDRPEGGQLPFTDVKRLEVWAGY